MSADLVELIRERGPVTVAAFMDLALYDPAFGYYARAERRSGRAGDFFTSVDVGPLFGELLAMQIAEMARLLESRSPDPESPVDLVEAGAGNGRLAADILQAARRRDRDVYDRLRVHLVEASAEARRAQAATLGPLAERLASSTASLPASFSGILLANELIDAMPVHQVVMREDGLREIYVTARRPVPALTTVEGPPSTPALQAYLDRLGVRLEPGWRVEINLRAVDWMREAVRRLQRGFVLLIDYGHDARELYSASHGAGTLTAYSGHRAAGPEAPGVPGWLRDPGRQDLTAHVDFTSLREAAEAEGLTTLGLMDQTYFVLGIVGRGSGGSADLSGPALKTLVMPGGLGSTHKVLLLGKGVGAPALDGCSYRARLT